MPELFELTGDVSFAFSAENPTGEKGGGSRGKPWEKLRPCISIAPGETVTLAQAEGPAQIEHMWFTGSLSWELVLRIYWDGQAYPSVEAPLCAFMGYGYPKQLLGRDGSFPALTSAMVTLAPCMGMNCYWPMPFARSCRIEVENLSPRDSMTLYYLIKGRRRALPEKNALGYFHASYRQQKPVDLNVPYTVIDGIRGRGKYVGTALYAGTNGSNGCWVEGEAKMYIDGDEYPSVNYTGLEDYFGGAYAFGYDNRALNRYQTYSAPYIGMYAVLGQDDGQYREQPRYMLYHWHIPDPVEFETDFRMTLQDLGNFAYGQKCRRDDFSSVAYWYQTLPSLPLRPLPPAEELDAQ